MARSAELKGIRVTVGDTIKLQYAFMDNDKRKSQLFEGIILSIRGRGDNKMMTVRKVTRSNIGVERIFPLASPFIDSVEIAKATSSTRASLMYIRTRSKRDIKEKLYS
ncbi:hypothetical protein A3B02_00840 [Candidatus Roizmanbacteria bacterium RIFCSPLOWO2_01_FULL_42_14]|uniref:50S ribosomal protein L19 n=4 Tax=Candidatus Roizmaniibacteriota TaxID=1752723 RepID=A0A1F7JXD4_9BACT|nr:MAG: hypothetical protein A3D08_02830 [Candidatus Roizmanbacteria bacterium RIFCSPHIGHO2_02_FULL_43_11]OGK38746.1 MAG: hypothetical protein A3F32_00655 [Candidatus Roizmanbacteria bacterium RIFCSPHIGHO2_12_FULL_42_10]OGK51597.1 MAG: hypothetical protein A3B02_00840 [Candidatus Roizmanbacteria bacterium RIFCSPLOWO2_01_FULL_42_14]OGK60247.1 MAG: hypothetical protein A3I56_01630 [Candidatus Roizmanbacteria bacterium RIFCSPLOWO2_02_FULL_43_10]